MDPSLSDCEAVLKVALTADENGQTEEAFARYTEFIEMTLKSSGTCIKTKQRLQALAAQALDRAEALKTSLSRSRPATSSQAEEVSLGLPSEQPVDESPLKLALGAPSSYSSDELRVLEHGSRINQLIVVPFMSVDLRERFIFPLPFTDPDGLLALAPKQKQDLSQWLRISEISDEPTMVAHQTIDYTSVKQTLVSDCSFVASLAVAAQYEMRFGKALVSSILYPKNKAGRPVYNPSGKYSVKLHINGVPRKVIVDDYLPTSKYNQLLCSHSKHRHEFWVSVLEKAYMKVMGGYDFPGSNSNIDLHALTGWIPERISINDSQQSQEEASAVFTRLQNGLQLGRCLITAATGELSDVDEKRTGLVPTHAYAVLDLREVDGVQLVQMKNPWSHLRWKGNYSEADPNWTEELKRTLNYDPSKAEEVDNGIFWIDYRSVRHFFDVFYINWDPSLFQNTYCVHQMWNAGVGPTKDAYSIAENPQFLLKVGPGQGSVWVLLTRHITSIDDFRNNREYITIVAYENGGRKVYYPYDPKPFHEGTRINSPHYLCKIRQDPQRARAITLAISQYEKSTTIYFTLRAYSRDRFELQQIDSGFVRKEEITGHWKGITAGGCPNYPMTHKNNPKFRLSIGQSAKSKATVSIELRGPKVYQVGFELTQLRGAENFPKTSSGSYRSGYSALEVDLPAGTYLLIPTTFLPAQESPFIVTVKSQSGLKLVEVTNDFEFRP